MRHLRSFSAAFGAPAERDAASPAVISPGVFRCRVPGLRELYRAPGPAGRTPAPTRSGQARAGSRAATRSQITSASAVLGPRGTSVTLPSEPSTIAALALVPNASPGPT